MTMAQPGTQTTDVRHCPDCGIDEAGPERFCKNCYHLKGAPPNIRAATFLRRLAAYILDGVLFFLTLVIGYIIWWLFTLQNGQTPGKQLVGIRAVRLDGRPLGWGMSFVREFVIKFLLIGFLSNISFGILWLVDYLFPLFDRDQQALHDKIVSSLVVRHDPFPVNRSSFNTSDDPWASQQVEGR